MQGVRLFATELINSSLIGPSKNSFRSSAWFFVFFALFVVDSDPFVADSNKFPRSYSCYCCYSSSFNSCLLALFPSPDRAAEGTSAGLDVDPTAAGRAALARAAVAGAADFQTLAVLFVVDDAAAVAHERDDRLEEVRCLGRKRRKRLLRHRLSAR